MVYIVCRIPLSRRNSFKRSPDGGSVVKSNTRGAHLVPLTFCSRSFREETGDGVKERVGARFVSNRGKYCLSGEGTGEGSGGRRWTLGGSFGPTGGRHSVFWAWCVWDWVCQIRSPPRGWLPPDRWDRLAPREDVALGRRQAYAASYRYFLLAYEGPASIGRFFRDFLLPRKDIPVDISGFSLPSVCKSAPPHPTAPTLTANGIASVTPDGEVGVQPRANAKMLRSPAYIPLFLPPRGYSGFRSLPAFLFRTNGMHRRTSGGVILRADAEGYIRPFNVLEGERQWVGFEKDSAPRSSDSV